jgi:hypothetical protein
MTWSEPGEQLIKDINLVDFRGGEQPPLSTLTVAKLYECCWQSSCSSSSTAQTIATVG